MIPTFSPQGDGDQYGSNGTTIMYCSWVDPYLFPARGRKLEFAEQLRTGKHVFGVDPYLFPARGRKREIPGCLLGEVREVDPYLFPARGRKQNHRPSDVRLQGSLIPTFSPQGDGNSGL